MILTSANAVEVSKEEKITGLYVAYFNRAADQEGLTYWTDKADEVAKAGGDVSSVFKKLSGGFATHPTFKSTYDHLNNKEFVSLIYRNALGRAGDVEGIDYWTKKLDFEGMIRSDVVSDFVELSLLTDLTKENYPNLTDAELAAAQLRQDLITNKVLIALSFTIQLDELSNVANNQDPERDPAYLASIEIISDVTEDISTLLDLWDFLDSIYESDDPISEILSRSTNIYEVKTVTITKDNLFAEHEGVKITFSPFDIDGDEILTMQRMKPQPFGTDFGEMDTDYQIKIYDFTVNEKSERTSFVEITIPYDTSFINNKSESDNIFAVYYNSDKKQYEPIDYTIDTEKSEIKIMTNHLSQYGIVKTNNAVSHDAFSITREYTSKAKIIGILPSHGYIDSSEKAINIIKTFDSELGTSYDAFEAGFGTANIWLGLSAAGNTVASTAYASDFLQSLGNSFNAVGLGASIVQAGVDIQKGDIQSLYSNFLKNYTYNAVNYFGTAALQLAFVGVFVIDLSLNHLITVTLNDNEEKYLKVYNTCYNKYYYNTHTEWYYVFDDIWKKSTNPVEMEKAIQKALDDNVNSIWYDTLDLLDCTGSDTETTRGLSTVATKISQAKKDELMASLVPVFDQMAKTIRKDNKDKYINELRKLRDKLNQDIDVQIKETIKEGETPKYAGYIFRFSPLNDNTTKSNWTAKLHEDGSFHTNFTVLGHMQSGAPDKLEIFKPGDNPDTDKPVRTIGFKITPPNLVINIGDGEDTEPFDVEYAQCPMTYDNALLIVDLDNGQTYTEYVAFGSSQNYFRCTYTDDFKLYSTYYLQDGEVSLDEEWYAPSGELVAHIKRRKDWENGTWEYYDIRLNGETKDLEYYLHSSGFL